MLQVFSLWRWIAMSRRKLSVLAIFGCLLIAPSFFLFAQSSDDTRSIPDIFGDFTTNPWTEGVDLSGERVEIIGRAGFGLYDGNNDYNGYNEEYIQAFNSSVIPFEVATGIDIVFRPSRRFSTALYHRFRRDRLPDIAVFTGKDRDKILDLNWNGAIVDIGDWFPRSYLERQYSPAMIDMGTMDGDIVGLWHIVYPRNLVWYHRETFEREGYETPQTWDELIQLCREMVDDGYVPWAIGFRTGEGLSPITSQWPIDIAINTLAGEEYDEWTAGRLDTVSEPFREAFEAMESIWYADEFVLGGTQNIMRLQTQDVAEKIDRDTPGALMTLGAINVYSKHDGLDFFAIPAVGSRRGMIVSHGYMMSAFADRPEVRAAMRWFASEQSTSRLLSAIGGVPAQRDVASFDTGVDFIRVRQMIERADTLRVDYFADFDFGQEKIAGAVALFLRGESIEDTLHTISKEFPK